MSFSEPAKSEAQRIYDEYEAKHSVRCPVCSKALCPQKNGKVRRHNRNLYVGTFVKFEKCPGCGRGVPTLVSEQSN